MDYKKRKLDKINSDSCYEEIDTRLATGWYVDPIGKNKKKKYKTNQVSFKVSRKQINQLKFRFLKQYFIVQVKKLSHYPDKVSNTT